jgi:hypothetical protein
LHSIRFRELSPAELKIDVDLALLTAGYKLHLNFDAVDPDEIKHLSISFDGNLGFFKNVALQSNTAPNLA